MRLIALLLVGGLAFAAGLASLRAGCSVWVALGIYALVIDLAAVSCLIVGALLERLAAHTGAGTGRATPALVERPC